MTQLDVDIVIVGSGAAGGTLAATLAEVSVSSCCTTAANTT